MNLLKYFGIVCDKAEQEVQVEVVPEPFVVDEKDPEVLRFIKRIFYEFPRSEVKSSNTYTYPDKWEHIIYIKEDVPVTPRNTTKFILTLTHDTKTGKWTLSIMSTETWSFIYYFKTPGKKPPIQAIDYLEEKFGLIAIERKQIEKELADAKSKIEKEKAIREKYLGH